MRIFTLNSPLGEDLLFKGLTGQESIGNLFSFTLTALSKRNNIQAKELLGNGVTIAIETVAGKRYLNAQVVQFQKIAQEERYSVYQAELRPWLWYAGISGDCRIFQHKTVVQIADEVLARYPFTVRKKLYNDYKEIGYCVQYNESDLDFLSRQLEQEGIYYYFEHQDGEHALVLADDIGSHKPVPGYERIRFVSADQQGTASEECMHEWGVVETIKTGQYITDDYDFKKSKAVLKQTRNMPHDHAQSTHEIYEWGHGFTESAHGEHLAKIHLEQMQQGQTKAHAKTNVRGIGPGYTFTMFQHPDSAQNIEYLITAADYSFKENPYSTGDDVPDWGIDFSAQKSTEPYRAVKETERPYVHGVHTATVSGPAGEEIWCDKFGRVKLQFPWDRYGKSDENSSCWIRVSSPWAGDNFGVINLPRIGQEVLVEYVNGDINRPIITGRVYNDFHMPPWTLPDNATQSGVLSRSSKKGGYENANALRFEDKKGAEQVWLQAERNMDTVVEKDETHSVGHDRTKTIGHDENSTIKHDQNNTVKHDKTLHVANDQAMYVKQDEGSLVGRNRRDAVSNSYTIEAGTQIRIVCGDSVIEMNADGNVALSCKNFSITASDSGQINTLSGRLDLNLEGAKAATEPHGQGKKSSIDAEIAKQFPPEPTGAGS
jgi:type VI secretion system secreted protein VgrG